MRDSGSPTPLRVPSSGGCEDLDMDTEEEDDMRVRGELQQAPALLTQTFLFLFCLQHCR